MRTSCRTDLFVEVTNLMKGNTVWVHFTATGYFPTNIHLSRPIPKESVRIETHCCIFKQMIIDWTNTEVTGISGIRKEMPNEAKMSIFTDNDLTHITDDHFEINLTLPSLTHLAPLKSLVTLYINICKITIFPSTQYAYIYAIIFICKLC